MEGGEVEIGNTEDTENSRADLWALCDSVFKSFLDSSQRSGKRSFELTWRDWVMDAKRLTAGEWIETTIGDQATLQRSETYKSKLKNTPGPYLLRLGSIKRNGGFRVGKLVTYDGENSEILLVYPGELRVPEADKMLDEVL